MNNSTDDAATYPKTRGPVPQAQTGAVESAPIYAGIGIVFALCGASLMYYAWAYDIGVYNGSFERIVNSGLSNDRIVLSLFGSSSMISGIIITGYASIIMSLNRLAKRAASIGSTDT